MHHLTDRRVWAYALVFAAFYAVMKFAVPWHLIVS
jgi:hypothetical protein